MTFTPQQEQAIAARGNVLVMAGAGPDGALVYKMLADGKQKIGRFAYYHRAARLFAKHHFAAFDIEFDCTWPVRQS